MDVLMKINHLYCDDSGKPIQILRIRHTLVLEDPFPDLPGMEAPDQSPEPIRLENGQLDDEIVDEDEGKTVEQITEERKIQEANANTEVLVMVRRLSFKKHVFHKD